MPIHEDIFGAGTAIELIVRWHDKIIADFDNANQKTFEQLKNLIDGQELKCFFLKVKENEQKIIIPFTDEEFQFELYVDWDEKTFSYKAKVKSNKKSRIVQPISIPEEKEYFIEESCKLVFIDINESRFPIREQVSLFDRVKKLDILPKTKIENDCEIWEKWIEAQDILLKRNAQPFKVKKYHQPFEVKNDSGETTRYKFKVDLFVDDSSEYKDVEEELLNEFSINETFDDEGNIFLQFDDIYRGLDAIIHKKFKDKIERDKGIATILKLKPLNISERVNNYFRNAGFGIFVFDEKNEKGHQKLVVTPVDIPVHHLVGYLDSQNYELREFKGDFKVINNGNDIITNSKLNTKYHLTFGDKFSKGTNVPELLLPKPTNNIFTVYREDEFDLTIFARTLQKIYGKENVLMRKSYVFQRKYSKQGFASNFTEDFWNDIKRDIYALDFKVETNTLMGTISYDFETREECLEKLKKLQAINKFQFTISPEQPDFKFKVKTNLLKNKTEKQIFFERIGDLANVDFQVPIGEEENRKKYLSIGKLIAQESDLSSLIFSIPTRRKDEQKLAKQLLEYVEEKKPINQVEPNLIGDQAKIGWLKNAMTKVVAPTDKPNGKAVNDKLGQFIFDSSKAEEVFKDISPDSEEWNRVKRNELLKLNDSQRKAILSALHARDLCLLQGPPGTGKTTVIAELIWQLISQNQEQKVLLTSETNLAVDNAIEKLLNKEHTLVKPLRFGKDTKFEEEGKKYSFNRIMKWIDEKFVAVEFQEDSLEENEDEEEIAPDNPYNNAVQIWMNRIAEKSHKELNPKYASALKDWAIELTQPVTSVKQHFKDKYFKYANVVGSTCSSSGSGDFSKSYQFIFNSKPEFKEEPNKKWNWIPVEFDTVIMDEASKATPPEMLLPLCFGKKSVVIGDHKQLPPMLNEKEFKEALSELKSERAVKLAEEIDKEFVETSQFERLIMNPKVPKSIAARLNIQYRMHPKINNVIKQFYTGETDEGLEPAQELIEHADTEDLNNPFSRHHGFWNEGFIKPDIHTIWINVNEPEEQSGTSRVNEKEVEAVKNALKYLKNSKGFEEYFNHWGKIKNEDKRLQEQEIGIISFYGHQVKKLQDVKRYAQKDLGLPIRLKTVDKFQGMERNIIIVSTVRSDKLIKGGLVEKNADIGFAKAPERLNVALSRARRLLIVVGNLKFFENYKDKNGNAIYKNAIDIIRKEGLIIEDYKTLSKYK
jgi:superfamily I DNA and/or RNA helicase